MTLCEESSSSFAIQLVKKCLSNTGIAKKQQIIIGGVKFIHKAVAYGHNILHIIIGCQSNGRNRRFFIIPFIGKGIKIFRRDDIFKLES